MSQSVPREFVQLSIVLTSDKWTEEVVQLLRRCDLSVNVVAYYGRFVVVKSAARIRALWDLIDETYPIEHIKYTGD